MRHVRVLTAVAALALAAQAGTSTYTLRWGDTLTRVAARFHVSVAGLAATNGIGNADEVRAGRTLQLAPAATAAASSTSSGGRSGSVGARAAAAAATPSRSAPAGRGAAASPPAATVRSTTYVVSAGDTLSAIAKRAGITVAALRSANQVNRPDRIRIGQRLALPAAPAGRVRAAESGDAEGGDTLLARAYCPVVGADRWSFIDSYLAPRGGGRRHEGVDIFAPRGTAVVAPVDGVLRRLPNPMGGLAVKLTGPGGDTFYGAHLSAYGAAGAVRAGDVIGRVGNSGDAAGTPPHLHFEYRPGGASTVNPYLLLQRWCR